MTRQDFISYLADPETLNGNSIGALEKLVKEYPYFQTGRLLFLKNLHNQNSIEYEKNLHITSAYAPGGKVLYNLIKKAPALSPKSQVPSLKSQEEEIVEGTQYAVDSKQPSNTEERPVAEVFPKEEVIVPVQAESTPLPEKKDEYDELQLLEKEMLREAYRTSLTVDLLGKVEEVQDPESKVDSPASGVRRSPSRSASAEQGLASDSFSFTDWMKVVSGKNPDLSLEEKSLQKKQKTELIDKFMLEEVAKIIPRPKVEFYSAEAMAKKSLQDDETFVSETLASIYLRQGNLQKALRAYEILVVKYPEKIHIFAPLLEKLKKLLQEQKNR